MSNPDFSLYALPEWSSPENIAHAISVARAAADRSSAMAAYNKLLDAIGNNHAGTYYPAAVALVPALAPLLAPENKWSCIAALQTLVDLGESFEPQRGFESLELSDGASRGTSEMLREAILELAPALWAILRGDRHDAVEKDLALEVLRALSSVPPLAL